MSSEATLALTNNQIKDLLDKGQLNSPQLKTSLKQAKLQIYSKPNLEKETPAFIQQAIRFAELNLRFILASSNSKEYENAINTVKFFQQNSLMGKQTDEQRDKITAIHLLFLLSTNRTQEFYSKLQSITTEQLQQPHIAYVLKLNDAIEEGNYRQISSLRRENPLPQEFGPFLNSIGQTIRTEIAKSAEKAYAQISLKEAMNIFECKSYQELCQFVDKYQSGQEQPQMSWEFRGDTICFEQESSKKAKFNSQELIKKTLEYSVELEKIA